MCYVGWVFEIWIGEDLLVLMDWYVMEDSSEVCSEEIGYWYSDYDLDIGVYFCLLFVYSVISICGCDLNVGN